MDNEKYGIELELIMDKFNKKIETIKNKFKGIENQRIDIAKNASTDILQRKIKLAEDEMKRLTAQYAELSKEAEGRYKYFELLASKSKEPITAGQLLESDDTYQGLIEQLQRLQIQMEKTSIKSDTLKAKLNQAVTPKKAQEVKIVGSSFDGIQKGIERATSKIKRFGLSLLSVRSIFSLVSRASSAYLAQDEQLSNRLQATWAGLGAMLAPIIEAIINTLAKGVKYINIFIKALTGVDLLAKATAKSMAGTNKSAKALSKTLAGFDELQNIDTDTNAGADMRWSCWVE